MKSAPASARALFAAARADAPLDGARDAMWSRIAGTTGLAGIAATTASAASAATSPSVPPAPPAPPVGAGVAQGAAAKTVGAATGGLGAKLVLLGGVIGACGTALGVAVTLLVVQPSYGGSAGEAAGAATPSRSGRTVVQHVAARGTPLAATPVRARAAPSPAAASASESEAAIGLSSRGGEAAPASRRDATSDLAEEARLVTEARDALVKGDAAAALTLVQRTRRMPTRSLEPEELGLEARALRALGRTDEAAATELTLRRRFPESALAH